MCSLMSLQPNPIPDPDSIKTNETKQPKSSRLWMDGLLRIIKSKTSLIGLCIIIILIVTALLAPVIATHSPTYQSIIDRYQTPSSEQDRKSTRLNSSHVAISYAVLCLKKNKII